ncbi:amidase family protein [Gracilinema caldarium]|uniref:amidase family protein n=1 Tax=Gracilinema caldarium TaxID=215591 RepID=UPI0026F3294B|nr:amidase family protein [Gracilinema caldarium]
MSRSVDLDGFPVYFSAWEAKIGSFLECKDPEHWEAGSAPGAASPVADLPFAAKDNIAALGFGLTCGSRLLEDFRATYTATAIQRLTDAGAKLVGKTNLDEFGMGSSTDNSALKRTNNPWDPERVAGGSSGGSAAAVAAGLVPFALGSDTGGSVRQPAAFCGVVGLKPTYGAVSRFGLVAYASSLETIGILADSSRRARDVFRIIEGEDPLDETTAAARLAAGLGSAPQDGAGAGHSSSRQGAFTPGGSGQTDSSHAGKILAVLDSASLAEAVRAAVQGAGRESTSGAAVQDGGEHSPGGRVRPSGIDPRDLAEFSGLLEQEVLAGFSKAVDAYRAMGYRIREVSIPSLAYSVPVYYTIATAEASANLARFDGIRYGKRPEWAENPEDLIDKTRAMGFGPEVKLRILLGTFVLRSGFQDRYYLQAQRLRKRITADFLSLFSGDEAAQALLMPVFPTRAFGREGGKAGSPALSSFAQKAADLFTVPANLAGLPAISFPASVEGGLPVGVQLVGSPFSEELLCALAEEYETAHPIPHPEGFTRFWR